jgi:hypothetical protein
MVFWRKSQSAARVIPVDFIVGFAPIKLFLVILPENQTMQRK